MFEQAFTLLITNRKEITRAYQQALEMANCQVQIAATGHQGQLALLFTQPDLVIMDYILPDMLAGVIVRQIRANARLKDTPVFMIDDYSSGADQDFIPGLLSSISLEQVPNIISHLQLSTYV